MTTEQTTTRKRSLLLGILSMNVADSEKMLGMLEKDINYELTEKPAARSWRL